MEKWIEQYESAKKSMEEAQINMRQAKSDNDRRIAEYEFRVASSRAADAASTIAGMWASRSQSINTETLRFYEGLFK